MWAAHCTFAMMPDQCSRGCIAAVVHRLQLQAMKAFFLSLLTLVSTLHAAAPTAWTSRGIGAGGGMFSPSISPHDGNVMFIAVDMSHLMRTTNGGASWVTLDSAQLQGKQLTEVQFTSTPSTLFAQDQRYSAVETALARPVKSTDLGDSWSTFANWTPSLRALSVHANPQRSDTFLACVGSTSGTGAVGKIYFYQSAGLTGSFTVAYSFTTNQGRLLGAFWDGSNVWLGTNDGLLFSSNGGLTFSSAAATGMTGTIGSFAAAKDPGTGLVRCYAISTTATITAQSSPQSFAAATNKVWQLDWAGSGASTWADVTGAIATTGVDHPTIIAMAKGNINVVHVASNKTSSYPHSCTVWRLSSVGGAWQSIFTTAGNGNISTGWGGINSRAASGNRQFETAISYAAPCGLAVNPTNPAHAVFCDNAVIHQSLNASAASPTWAQCYCVGDNVGHAAGQLFSPGQSYLGTGMECTVWLALDWVTPSYMQAACLDIKGPVSSDGGQRWGFPYDHSTISGGDFNSVTHDPQTSLCYAAAANTVTAYEVLGCDDAHTDLVAQVPPGVYYRTTAETVWHALKTDFGVATGQPGAHPVWLTFDDPHRKLYVSIVSSNVTKDGIYVLDLTTSTWSKLLTPMRSGSVVQHPFNIRVFANGDVLASYCAHQLGDAQLTTGTNGYYKPTSGLYYLPSGSSTWQDRTKTEMRYFTRDVIVDPHDVSGLTWFATVWNTDTNNVSPTDATATPKSWGGLYRTVDGGTNWLRIWAGDATFSGSATSCTIHPEAAVGGELLLTTRFSGLWITSDCHATSPTFTRVSSYRFRAPERVYYEPSNHDKLWITSNGNGLVEAVRPSSYAEWSQRQFGSLLSASSDNDSDGSTNALEYALQGNPQHATPGLVSSNGIPLNLTFQRNLTAADTTWSIEVSSDLINWTPLAQAISNGGWSTPTTGTLTETSDGQVVFTDSIAPSSMARCFLRLSVLVP